MSISANTFYGTAMALAVIAFTVALGVAVQSANHQGTYRLLGETDKAVSILDHGMTLEDCAAAARYEQSRWGNSVEMLCQPEPEPEKD